MNIEPPNLASDALHAALGFSEVGRATTAARWFVILAGLSSARGGRSHHDDVGIPCTSEVAPELFTVTVASGNGEEIAIKRRRAR